MDGEARWQGWVPAFAGTTRGGRSRLSPAFATVDSHPPPAYVPPSPKGSQSPEDRTMKVVNSLKSAKARHKDCRIVRRKGRVYVINKTNPRYKARQG